MTIFRGSWGCATKRLLDRVKRARQLGRPAGEGAQVGADDVLLLTAEDEAKALALGPRDLAFVHERSFADGRAPGDSHRQGICE